MVKIKTKDIALIGMLTAVLLVSKEVLAFLPNVELVSLLIIVYTIVFKKKTIYILFTFITLEAVLYGITMWFINYLYIWLLLYFVTRLFSKERSAFIWAVISGLYGTLFGALCSIPYFFVGGFHTGIAYWFNGIPFDIVHGISNFIVAFVLFNPLYILLNKLNRELL